MLAVLFVWQYQSRKGIEGTKRKSNSITLISITKRRLTIKYTIYPCKKKEEEKHLFWCLCRSLNISMFCIQRSTFNVF